MKKQPQMPSRDLKIKIGENEYKITFPGIGKIIDMERMKIELTNGTQKDMLFGVGSGPEAYVLVEMVAAFSILIPDLKKDLLVTSLLELDPLRIKPVRKQYETVFYPWWKAWQDVLNADDDVVEKQEEEEDKGEDKL